MKGPHWKNIEKKLKKETKKSKIYQIVCVNLFEITAAIPNSSSVLEILTISDRLIRLNTGRVMLMTSNRRIQAPSSERVPTSVIESTANDDITKLFDIMRYAARCTTNVCESHIKRHDLCNTFCMNYIVEVLLS